MRILWIEDFPKESDKPSSLAANLFKDVLGLESFDEDYESLNDISKELPNYFKIKNSIHEIVVCKSYHEYINTHDLKYLNFDIFIVDINLTDAEPNNSLIPAGFNRKDFLEKSGFYIWNLLIRKGVPEDQIAFMTGNGNSVSDFEKHCRDANIPLLKTENVFEKSEENEDSPKFKRGYISFRKWLQLKASNPYIQLRRGILDGCEYLLKNTPEEILLNRTLKKDGEGKKIDELSQEYGKEFLIRLQGIQQKEFHLDGKEKTQKLYTFLMTLVSEWERGESKDAEQKEHFKDISDEDEKTFYETSFWILNNIRNCFAHFTFDKENLNEQDIAFFFILAIRGFFKLDINDTLDYEKILFSIMPKANEIITKEQIEKQNSKS
ncbi:MAG TPA: hypothetical protein PKD50_08245, partial [Leptospiraceae bacterium]|nr:hypothetical protein [Leptospiraceae bacterium]